MPTLELTEAEEKLLEELRELAERIKFGTIQVQVREGKPVKLSGNCSVLRILKGAQE